MANKTTVVRDFQGGLNIVDDDLNLNSSFQTTLDNIQRGVDSSLSVRWGYELFANLLDGAEVTGSTAFDVDTTNASRIIDISWTSHGFSNREHITFTTPITVGGLTLSGPYGVIRVDANNFQIVHRDPATSTATHSAAKAYKRDNHMLAGTVLDVIYFNDFIVVTDSIGEICKIDADGTKTRIFDVAYSNALSGSPTGWTTCSYVSSDIYKGDLIIVNGEDKPLLCNFDNAQEVSFLIDIPSGSNTNVPVCKYVKSIGQWLVMAGDPTYPYRIHISCTDAGGTWVGDAAPNDAVDVDVNNVSNSPSQEIRGINKFRDFCVVAFDDTFVLVELGNITGSVHEPDINDTIARHGSVAHKSMIFLGYDLLACDPIGVTSIAKSIYDASVVPTRLSEFIAPMMQQNLGRLSQDTLSNIFAVYSTHDTRYMVFMPNYDDDTISFGDNPFYVTDTFSGTGTVLVEKPNHGFEAGDSITIAGAVDVAGIAAASLNTTHIIAGVIDEDFFVLEVDDLSTFAEQGGGSGVTATRNKTETTGYAYTYNKGLKVRTWARYKDMNFVAGCTSVYGRVFLATEHRIWRMGNRFEPIHSDLYNNYDSIWATATAYVEGDKIYDAVTNETYTCLVDHTSSGATFAAYRADNVTHWERYEGEAIQFVAELPWADFDKRDLLKVIKQLGVDARGKGSFTVQMFVDYYYRSKLDGSLTPELELEMSGGDTGGYGAGVQNYGSGRIATRQRLWPFNSRGKLFKIRVTGETTDPLRIVAFIIRYALGGTVR